MRIVVAALMLLPPAMAQSTDWQTVKSLPFGTQLSLQIGRHWLLLKCHLEEVTDDALTCAQGWPVPLQAVTYARERIRTVRKAHNTALIGLIVGAGAGTAIGLARDPRPGLGRGGDAVITAGLLGLFGAGVGGIVSPLFPGRVIYRAPAKSALPRRPQPMSHRPTGATESKSSSRFISLGGASEASQPLQFLFFTTDPHFVCEPL